MKIVQTMMIQAVMVPYGTLCAAWTVPKMKQCMDKPSEPYKTKKTSMHAYKTLYGGKDYVIHVKYSGVLNVTFITMMYGIGMPILFPIAMVNLIN